MDRVDPNAQSVRHAIWESYNYKCFYSDESISIQDMELDHIVPQSLKDYPEKLKEIIKKQDLDPNFELDSLYNLVPAKRNINNRKRGIELPPAIMAIYLEKARMKVPLILHNIEKYKKNIKQDKHLSLLKGAVQDNKITPDKIYYYISEEKEDFNEEIGLFEQDKTLIYKHYTKKIALEATMPIYTNPDVNCVLSFRALKIRDCIMVLDNKTILTDLFEGLFTDPIYGIRGFLEYEHSNVDKADEINLEMTVVRLGNNKIKLSRKEIYLLCEIIDAFAEKYFFSINKIESILKTQRFQLSKRKNGYKLTKVSCKLWLKLIEFACKYDVDNGLSDWHIFDRNNYSIKVYTEKEHPKYSKGFHAFFYPEFDEDKICYPFMTGSDVWIVWELMEDLENRGAEHINEKENWNAEIAYNWLMDDFIPRVSLENNKGLVWFRRNEFFKSSRKNMLSELFSSNKNIVYINNTELKTIGDIYGLVENLQKFSNLYPHRKFRLKKDEISGIYESIIIAAEKCYKIDLHYISGKLSIKKFESKNDLIDTLNLYIKNIKNSTVCGFDVDLLLRSLLIILSDVKMPFSEEELFIITKRLSPIVNLYNRLLLIDKYAVTQSI